MHSFTLWVKCRRQFGPSLVVVSGACVVVVVVVGRRGGFSTFTSMPEPLTRLNRQRRDVSRNVVVKSMITSCCW